MKIRYLIVCLGAILLLAGALSASPIHVIWTGTVTQGDDFSNTFGFGPGSQDLAGKNFTAEFVVDPTKGLISSSYDAFSTEGGSLVSGGSYASPILSASLTINGRSFEFHSDYYGSFTEDRTWYRKEISTYSESWGAWRGTVDEKLSLQVIVNDNSIWIGGLLEPLDIDLPWGALGTFVAYKPNSPEPLGQNRLFWGNLNPTHLKISTDTPGGPDVPEPASGVLLVAGLGAIALGFRRRLTPRTR